MATFTGARAAATVPVYKGSGAGNLSVAYGSIEVTANPVANDVYRLCKLPAGAVVVGGRFLSDDLDTNATETLDLDLGWEGNGVEAADPDGFGNFGVLGIDTVAGAKPEAGYNYALGGKLITDGPQAFSAETMVSVTCVATAATFAAGTISCVIYYVTP